MSIFKYTDYKKILREGLYNKRTKVSTSFTYERMAKACGIQKTYLSRVLNSDDSHLSEEQLFLAAAYLGLSREEQRYIQVLRAYQKACKNTYKDELQRQLEQMRSQYERSESHLEAEAVPHSTDISPYYLDPNVMLIHIFLAVDRYQKDIRSIAAQLNLTVDYISDALTKLEQMKFIALTENGYKLLKESTHLPIDSPLYYPYRFMQRVKALERIQKLPKDKAYNFSVVFSADEEARKQIKAKFLEFLEFVEKVATSAADKEIYQINFDLFDWSS